MSVCFRVFLTSMVLLLLAAPSCSSLTSACDLERIRIPGDIILSAVVGLREPIDGVCGDRYIPSEIQVASAMVWATEKLKGTQEAESFIRGRSVGIELADDCSLERKSVQIALNTLVGSGSPDLATCSKTTYSQESSHIAGIIHTSTSQTAGRVAELYRDTNIPVIATSATAAALSNKTHYSTLVRTVPSDVEQMMVLIKTVKQMNWTYIAVVYTEDTYGIEGLRLLKEFAARDEKVCIMMAKGISPQETRLDEARSVLASITRLSKTRLLQLGVVYIGQLAQAELLTQGQYQAGRNILYKDFLSLYWIMSEAVGTNMQLNPNNQAGGVLTVALSSIDVSDFKRYFLNQLEEAIRPTTAPRTQMSRLYEKYVEAVHACKIGPPAAKLCRDLDTGTLKNSFKQQDYVASAIDAVYVLASAVKKEFCSDSPECDRITSVNQSFANLASSVLTSTLDYSTIDVRLVPYEFHLLGRKIQFDDKGDIVTENGASSYVVFNVWEQENLKVSEYENDQISLKKESIKMKSPSGTELSGSRLPRSICAGSCPECITQKDIPFSYTKGDRIIVGLFSLSETGENDFLCGKFRTDTDSYLTFEAFNYAIRTIREYYPTMNFGGLAFDDCYSPLRAQYILTNFLSGQYKLVDRDTNQLIDPSKVVLVIGPLSSGVTLEVADILTRLNIPQISYGASSTDLDNRQKYPYFLRTVPSDESQAEAIVNILVKMKWNAVAVIYMNNNYGIRGMRTFKEKANKKGICVRHPEFPVSNSMSREDFKDIVSQLRYTHTQVVLYFGIDTLAKIILDGMKESAKEDEFVFIATEAWGRNGQLLSEGRGKIAKGAIVLHLDALAPTITTGFKQYMEVKNPYTCKKCEWLKLFWQDHFKCDLEDSYTGVGMGREVCNQKDHGQFEANKNQNQRIIPTVTAVTAAAKAIKSVVDEICEGKACFINLKLVAKMLTERISNVTLDSVNGRSIFTSSGNGKIGFEILNVQYVDHQYNYIPVGHFSDSEFDFNPDEVVLYDKLNQKRRYTDVETTCFSTQCQFCENQLKPYESAAKTLTVSATTMGPLTENYSTSFIAPTTIAVLAIIALAVVVTLFVLHRRQNTQARRGGDNQIQEMGHSNSGFRLSELSVAQSNSSHHINNAQPNDPIYWEVSSHNRVNIGKVKGNGRHVDSPRSGQGSMQSSVNGSGSGETIASSTSKSPAQLLRQHCICADPKLYRHLTTAAGNVLVCDQCRGISTLPDNFSNA